MILITTSKKEESFTVSLEKVADLYNCPYFIATNIQELKSCLQESYNFKGVKIIEVKMVINKNISAHRDFHKKIKQLFINS